MILYFLLWERIKLHLTQLRIEDLKPLNSSAVVLWLLVFIFFMVRALDSKYRDPGLLAAGWSLSQLSLSSLHGRSNEYQELLGVL